MRGAALFGESARVSGQVPYRLGGERAVRAARFVVGVFEQSPETTQFGEYREVRFRDDAMAEDAFSGER
jgi:hypothetical protein